MNDRDRYKRERQLRQAGVDTDTGAVRLHSGIETPTHVALKALLAAKIRRKGRPFGTEVGIDERGRVDVLDWGPPDGRAVVYEVETDCTPKRGREKVQQYDTWITRDVVVVPADDAPESVGEAWDWLDRFVIG